MSTAFHPTLHRHCLLRQFELWFGAAAVVCTKRVLKQKPNRQDVQLILRLFMRFLLGELDLRQLPWHGRRKEQART